LAPKVANTDDELYSDLASAEAQRALLIAIFKFYVAEKKSPTYRELAKLMARTISTIHRAARELRTKGYIDEDPESSRAEARNIVLTEYAVGWLKFIGHDVTDYLEATTIKDLVRAIPVLGEIAAGNPILTEGNVESYMALPAGQLPLGKIFALNVVGDSMTGDGVLDGDQVLIVPYSSPKGEGEMVVALIEDAATVKRLWRDGHGYRLEPSNPDFDPIMITAADRFLIQGRVVGLLRWNIS
jgi:repressor LexA